MLRFSNIMICLSIFTVALSIAPAANADELAKEQLPAALEVLGIESRSVLSDGQAHEIRGAAGCCTGSMGQATQFAIAGQAEGQVTIFEGIIGQFRYTGDSGIVVEGSFGGVQGVIGVVDGALVAELQGKAYQEVFNFAGQYVQEFAQSYQNY